MRLIGFGALLILFFLSSLILPTEGKIKEKDYCGLHWMYLYNLCCDGLKCEPAWLKNSLHMFSVPGGKCVEK